MATFTEVAIETLTFITEVKRLRDILTVEADTNISIITGDVVTNGVANGLTNFSIIISSLTDSLDIASRLEIKLRTLDDNPSSSAIQSVNSITIDLITALSTAVDRGTLYISNLQNSLNLLYAGRTSYNINNGRPEEEWYLYNSSIITQALLLNQNPQEAITTVPSSPFLSRDITIDEWTSWTRILTSRAIISIQQVRQLLARARNLDTAIKGVVPSVNQEETTSTNNTTNTLAETRRSIIPTFSDEDELAVNPTTSTALATQESSNVDILSDLQDNVSEVPGEAWGIKFSYTVPLGTVQNVVTGNVRRDLSNRLEDEVAKVNKSNATIEERESAIQNLTSELEGNITNAVEEILATTNQDDEQVLQENAWFMQMLPAIRSNVGLQGATDVPGAQPGLTFGFKTNTIKHKIIGFQPVYQSLGIDSVRCTLVGTFTGADGPNVGLANSNSPLRNSGHNPDIDFLAPFATSNFNDLITKFDSYSNFQSFLKTIVIPQRQVNIEINIGRYGQSTSAGNNGFLRSVNGNPAFTAIVQSINAYYVRYDRTWYIMELEITDAGLVSEECLNLTNIIDNSIDTEAEAELINIDTEEQSVTSTECLETIRDEISRGVFKQISILQGPGGLYYHKSLYFLVRAQVERKKRNTRTTSFVTKGHVPLTRLQSFNSIIIEAKANSNLLTGDNIVVNLAANMIKRWATTKVIDADSLPSRTNIGTIIDNFNTPIYEVFYADRRGYLIFKNLFDDSFDFVGSSISESATKLTQISGVIQRKLSIFSSYFDRLLADDFLNADSGKRSIAYLSEDYCYWLNNNSLADRICSTNNRGNRTCRAVNPTLNRG